LPQDVAGAGTRPLTFESPPVNESQAFAILEHRPDGSPREYRATAAELVEVLSDMDPGAEYVVVTPQRVPPHVFLDAAARGFIQCEGAAVRIDGRWCAPSRAPSFSDWVRATALRLYGARLVLRPLPAVCAISSPTPASVEKVA
jgi:hypothetical protein